MSFLDAMIYGVRDVLANGSALMRRSKINFGSGLTATDDDTNKCTNVVASESAGGAIIFDTTSAKVNIRSDRSSNQSPVDNTKVGITNLGSDTSGATVGVTANYATCSGGDQNVATQDYASCGGGFQNTASGFGSCIPGGLGCAATGEGSFACGAGTLSTGAASFACCSNAVAQGNSSAAFNTYTLANGIDSFAAGNSSAAIRSTQRCTAGGMFAARGDAQKSEIVLRGETPGIGAGESAELFFGSAGDQVLTLENTKGYNVHVQCIAKALGGAGDDYAGFNADFICDQEGGVLSIVGGGALPVSLSTAGAATWLLTIAIAAAPARISLVFNTGATTLDVRVACTLTFTEVARNSAA